MIEDTLAPIETPAAPAMREVKLQDLKSKTPTSWGASSCRDKSGRRGSRR
jgi:hypothetical protein